MRILITGRSSYIGKSLQAWLLNYPNRYCVDLVSLREDGWKGISLAKYDVVFHAAGIAHVSSDPRLEPLYTAVNTDLAIEVASKAKADGVHQFIFLSTILIFGHNCNENGFIDGKTLPDPRSIYAASKLKAEEGLRKLEDDEFRVAILRLPMVYGKDCKGNYQRLAKLARITPVFPDFECRRSMIHIDNLCEFVRLIIDNTERGTFHPQNAEYVKVSEMVRIIAEVHGKRVVLTKAFNPLVRLLCRRVEVMKKVFDNVAYDEGLSSYREPYQIRSLRESIELSEY